VYDRSATGAQNGMLVVISLSRLIKLSPKTKALLKSPEFLSRAWDAEQTKVLSLTIALGVALPCLAQTTQPFEGRRAEAVFEELPVLNASEILRPEFLAGPHHKVREPVPTYFGANQFTIDSDFGVFEAHGNEMLIRRIKEINAIAQLKDVSRTDEYEKALIAAAKSPVAAAKNIVNDPVNTISNVPKGIMKFMSRARDSVKNIGKKTESSAAEGSKMQQLIGFSDTKRKVAIKLGVDPYSTNTVLQHELDGIAWASFAGGATFSLATLPIGGGAGAALTVTDVSSSFDEMLREKSPADLKIINRKTLLGLGAGAKETEGLLNNSAFSPSEQTAFVLNLRALNGVANRGAFVRTAGETSSDESDAIFCAQTAALMAQIHKNDKPLARITMLGDFPICVAKDGTIIVAFQWDYAAWTAGAAAFTDDVQKLAAQPGKNKNVLVALSGQVSSRLREELEKRGFTVRDRLAPGPLK
jgi:hypothetical protein